MKNTFLSLLLICVTVVWGWTFVIVRDATSPEVYGVVAFLTLRFAVASVTLIYFARRINRRTLTAGLGFGMIVSIGYLCQTFGLRYTTATNSGLITGLFVIFVPVTDFLLFKNRPPRTFLLIICICFAGIICLAGGNLEGLSLGDLLTLGCAVAFGVDISLLSRYAKNHDPGALMLVQMISSAIICAVVWWLTEPFKLPPDFVVWQAILLTGIAASALAFTIQAFVQQRISSVRAAVILTTEPMFASIFGYLLAGDRLKPIQILGGVFILAGILTGEVLAAIQQQNRK
ncbi:TPA: DMT family transporter [Candidatus Poribacteria bacterium]|nr:DMT family transporter [Candidatus Poribacteria bacterium]HIN27652.1 DMT family transporter [Candidatus Poribacteria bacterium]